MKCRFFGAFASRPGALRAPRRIFAVSLLLVACGDDTAVGAGGTGASGGSGTTGGAGGIAASGGAGGDASNGGNGGSGGSLTDVDPLQGVAPPELISGGFQFTEGTIWIPALGVLRFSDIPANTIFQLDANDVITVWRSNSANTNGSALAPNGDLIMCEHSGRRLSRSPANGSPAPTAYATTYQGDRFNSPNDAIVRSDGTTYFTDPTYGLTGPQEIAFRGVFRVDTGGTVHLVDDSYNQPNGIALSPDETKLYVSDSAAGGVYVYNVAVDGSTGPKTLLVDADPSDGMAVDDAGNLYLTVASGIEVHRPDGTLWGHLPVPQQPTNCAFGGPDRRTLFITAQSGLYRATLNIPGLP